jgi:uncharacterized membrane protein YgaE (UPF0421/DUF939 family)
MENQQSPVEFYREQLHALVSMRESKFETEREIFDQAKQIEKEQKEALYTKEQVEEAMLQMAEYITYAISENLLEPQTELKAKEIIKSLKTKES